MGRAEELLAAPFDFEELGATRAFLIELLVLSACNRGADSFITIFAWISSSLLALTFFGQKSVTNLTQRF